MRKLLALFGLFYILQAYKIDSYWLTLLHYKKNLWGNYESLIDDKNFFISKKGKYNPEKELLASIKLIKISPEKFACKFPLRYEYLNKKYNLSDFNISACKKLQKYLKTVNPKKAVLIFADADINKPASMFGHTFIRIDTPENLPVLSSAVNYAATVTDTNGILFAFKGIFGYYKAYYSLMPYYDKLKQYSDRDNRDLWGYELNLTPSEVRTMALHIWELKDIYSNYYFFKENCSYNILFLIEVAKPNVHLTDKYFLTVIPLDTVKDLKKLKMIKSYSYEPSLVKQIETISKPIKNKYVIVKIAKGQMKADKILDMNISNQQKARILDTSVRYLEYLSKKISIPRQKYTKRFLSILKARSRVNYISDYKYKTPFNPVNSHDSKRVSIGYEYVKHKYLSIGLRMAYHSLEDDIRGYKKGSSLQFGDFRFRYDKKLEIEKIGLIEIKSVTPRDVFFKPVSWKVNVGFYREWVHNKNRLVFKINPGGGFAKEIFNTYSYILFDTDMLFNKDYKKDMSLGFGPEFGVLYYNHKMAFIFQGGFYRYLAGDVNSKFYVKPLFRYSLDIQNAFTFSYTFERAYRHEYNRLNFNIYHYF